MINTFVQVMMFANTRRMNLPSLIFELVAYTTIVLLAFLAVTLIIYSIKTPSNNRNWVSGESKTASVQIVSDQVSIKNFRDADWANIELKSLNNDDFLFTDFEFKLSDIEALRAGVAHFKLLDELAHFFILFELKDGTNFALSVEARKEKGESYSLLGGLSARFELIYLLASYRDIVGLRLKRKEEVYTYPIKATPEEVQSLFKVVATRTNKIDQDPELYHLMFKNCTTEIVRLVNQISDNSFPRLIQSFMPGDAGKALYKMGLINIDAPFKEVQKQSLIKNKK